MPPTLMSRSDSEGAPPVTNACADGDHLRQAALGGVGPDARHGRTQSRLVRAVAAQLGHDGVRQEVRDAVDADRPEHDRPGEIGEPGAQMDAGARRQVRAETEPDGRVVVAAREHDRYTRRGEAGERVVEQGNGVGRRHRAVVDVSGDQDRVHLALDREFGQPGQERALVREQRFAVQGAPEMPVGRMEQTHGRSMRRGADSSAVPLRLPSGGSALPRV